MDEPHPIPRAGHWYVTPVLARTTEALERLAHTGAFIGVVKGPPGAGKSLLLERLAGVLAQDEQLAIAHLMAGAGKGGLLVGLAVAFGVPTDGNPTQTRRALIQHLTGLHGSGRCPVVLIDAAEHLSSLELSLLIRLGLSADKGKSGLMNVILAGSGDLDQRIAVAGEHLSRQRVYVAALPALTLEESLEFLARHTDALPPRLQGAAGRRAISRTGCVPGALIALLDDRPRGGRSLPVALVLATVIVTAIGAVLYRQLPDGFTGPAAAQPPAATLSAQPPAAGQPTPASAVTPDLPAPATRNPAGPAIATAQPAVAALPPASGPDTQPPAPAPVGHDGAPEPATGSDVRPPRPSGTEAPPAGDAPAGLPVPVPLPVPSLGAAQLPAAPEAPVTAPVTTTAPGSSVATAGETSPDIAVERPAGAAAPATQPDAPAPAPAEARPAPPPSPDLPSASREPPAATEPPAPPAAGATGTPDASTSADTDAVPPAVSGNGDTEAAAGPAPGATEPAAPTAAGETVTSADTSPSAGAGPEDAGPDPVRIEAPADSPAPAAAPQAPPVPAPAPPAVEPPPARTQGRPPAPAIAPPPVPAKPPARPRTPQPAAEPLARAPDTAWVVQLAATESETRLRSYAERNGLSGYVILRTRRNGQDWHVLLLGGFHPNQAAAETALTRLPEALRSETTPWVRSVRSLRRLLPPADPAP